MSEFIDAELESYSSSASNDCNVIYSLLVML